MTELSASEGILYSELVYRSLSNPEFFDSEGKFNIDVAVVYLIQEDEMLECCKINITKLAEALETSNPAIRRGLASLREKHLLGDEYIKCPVNLVRQKYLSLPSDTGLKGRQLVFLAYLINRGRPYRGIIDTWESKMAKDCGISDANVSSIMHILRERGFVSRTSDGKLKIREDLTTSPDTRQN